MNPRITISGQENEKNKNFFLMVHISASREDALELLAYGTRSVMETMGITLTDFLEAFMDAKETPCMCRTAMDTSVLSQLEQEMFPEN